jgi:hypothetical protein
MTFLMVAQLYGCGGSGNPSDPPTDDSGPTADDPDLTMDDPSAFAVLADDAVYIKYGEAKQMVRATPDGVSALDIGAPVVHWMDGGPDGSLLHVLAEGDAGLEHVFVKDGSIMFRLPAVGTSGMTTSPDGRHVALWFDDARDPIVGNVVDLRIVTFVDTSTGKWTDIATGVTTKTVVMNDDTGLVVGAEGAVSVDLSTQTILQSYDFASEKVERFEADGAVLSPDGAYGLISEAVVYGDDGYEDEQWIRVELADHRLDVWDQPYGVDTHGSTFFTLGGHVFVDASSGGLAKVDVTAMTIDVWATAVSFDSLSIVGNTAVLFSQTGPNTFVDADAGTVTPYAIPHQHDAWVVGGYLVAQTLDDGAWSVTAVNVATGWSSSAPLVDRIYMSPAIARAGSNDALLMYVKNVDDFVLMPLVDDGALTSAGPNDKFFGTMPDGETFYAVAEGSSTGRVVFIDPATGEQTVYSDLTSLGILTDPG